MGIRFAKKTEKKDIREIWDYCFNDSPKFADYYFENKYKNDNTIVIDEDKEIVSSLQLNQYKVNLNNKLYNTSYIVGVSTLPQARGNGYMKHIMEFTLRELYNKKQLVSILMPIDYRLYRRYGYEHCYDQVEYTIDVEVLKSFKSNRNMRKASISDIECLKNIYNFFTGNLNGYVYRDKDYYENLFKEIESEDGHIYIQQSEECEGYIIYFINGDNMFVREIFYKNIDSLKTMLKFIYNHNTQCKTVTISAPINDKIRYILYNPKTCTIKITPFMMGRIINFKEYMESLDVKSNSNKSLNIFIADEFIKENNGVFKIDLNDTGIKVEKIDSDSNYDICFDINTITQLAFSYIDIEEAFFLNNKTIDDKVKDFIEQIFVKRNNYINEYV